MKFLSAFGVILAVLLSGCGLIGQVNVFVVDPSGAPVPHARVMAVAPSWIPLVLPGVVRGETDVRGQAQLNLKTRFRYLDVRTGDLTARKTLWFSSPRSIHLVANPYPPANYAEVNESRPPQTAAVIRIKVAGAVTRPGDLEMPVDSTAWAAIIAAGGVLENTGKPRIHVIRTLPQQGGRTGYPLNWSKRGTEKVPFLLSDGDLIEVQSSDDSPIIRADGS